MHATFASGLAEARSRDRDAVLREYSQASIVANDDDNPFIYYT
jgi:hypothetical protein